MSARPDVLVGFMGAGKTTVGTRLAGLRVRIEDAIEPPLPLRIRAFG